METPQVFLIDLDGTLANTIPILYEVYQTFLRRHGRVGSPCEFSQLNGPALPEVVQQLAQRHGIEVPFPELYTEYRSIAQNYYVDHTPLFPGALEFLEHAHRAGKELALVTSAERPLATAFAQSHDISHYFSALVTPEGLPRSKPDPAIYERALEELEVTADQCVAVEDSMSGMVAAQGAGIRTIFMRHQGVEAPIPPEGLYATVDGWKDLSDRLGA